MPDDLDRVVSYHVNLFEHHDDGTAVQQSWWVDEKYASDMRAYMGEPDLTQLLTPADVEKSVALGEETLAFQPSNGGEDAREAERDNDMIKGDGDG